MHSKVIKGQRSNGIPNATFSSKGSKPVRKAICTAQSADQIRCQDIVSKPSRFDALVGQQNIDDPFPLGCEVPFGRGRWLQFGNPVNNGRLRERRRSLFRSSDLVPSDLIPSDGLSRSRLLRRGKYDSRALENFHWFENFDSLLRLC